jgi:hypothetical protein
MLANSLGQSTRKAAERPDLPEIPFCQEKYRLLDGFLKASQEMIAVQSRQTQAVIQGEPDFARFDVLIHVAQEKKEMAKYAWIAHVEAHRCEKG